MFNTQQQYMISSPVILVCQKNNVILVGALDSEMIILVNISSFLIGNCLSMEPLMIFRKHVFI